MGFLSENLLIMSGYTVERSSGWFLGLLFSERGILLCRTPSFEAACFYLLGILPRCRRRRRGLRDYGFEFLVEDVIVRG